ncbi:putative RNA-directed DNA polymerase [Rosa chinensis]|uniref:Putative RNA-directed DNA polymerase n=1 Tax=Rosa chinensis TaxID=74649 RepID=A0A2P6PBD1_ROSCH|nr:putative RNA-directed DNA polymerase [Rosa chinensis]
MAHGVCEMLWLRHLLRDLGFKQKKVMPIYYDNKAAIEIAHNPIQHDRTKHVEVDRHFIKEKLDGQIISFPFVPTKEQLANILTKAISSKTFYDSLDKQGQIHLRGWLGCSPTQDR